MSRRKSLRRLDLQPSLRRYLHVVRPDAGKLRRHVRLPHPAMRHLHVRTDTPRMRRGGVLRRRTANLPHSRPDAGPHRLAHARPDRTARPPHGPSADLPVDRDGHRQSQLCGGSQGGLRLHHLPGVSDRPFLWKLVQLRPRLLRHLRRRRCLLLQHGVQRRQDARGAVRHCQVRRDQRTELRSPDGVRGVYGHPVGGWEYQLRLVPGWRILRPAGVQHDGRVRRYRSGGMSGTADARSGGLW